MKTTTNCEFYDGAGCPYCANKGYIEYDKEEKHPCPDCARKDKLLEETKGVLVKILEIIMEYGQVVIPCGSLLSRIREELERGKG